MTEDLQAAVERLRASAEAAINAEALDAPRGSLDMFVTVAEESFIAECDPEVVVRLLDALDEAQANGSCWDEGPVLRYPDAECQPMPPRCELPAGHLGAHRSGRTEWQTQYPYNTVLARAEAAEAERDDWRRRAEHAANIDMADRGRLAAEAKLARIAEAVANIPHYTGSGAATIPIRKILNEGKQS